MHIPSNRHVPRMSHGLFEPTPTVPFLHVRADATVVVCQLCLVFLQSTVQFNDVGILQQRSVCKHSPNLYRATYLKAELVRGPIDADNEVSAPTGLDFTSALGFQFVGYATGILLRSFGAGTLVKNVIMKRDVVQMGVIALRL